LKILKAILAILFFVFGYVQFNDPDAVTWIVIYFAMSVFCLFSVFRNIDRRFLLFLLMFFFIYIAGYSVYLIEWIQLGMPNILEDDSPHAAQTERIREFFGLIICFAVMVYHYFYSAEKR